MGVYPQTLCQRRVGAPRAEEEPIRNMISIFLRNDEQGPSRRPERKEDSLARVAPLPVPFHFRARRRRPSDAQLTKNRPNSFLARGSLARSPVRTCTKNAGGRSARADSPARLPNGEWRGRLYCRLFYHLPFNFLMNGEHKELPPPRCRKTRCVLKTET